MGVYMKKIILFIAFLLLAALPKLIRPNAFFKSLFSSIPGTPTLLKGYNPITFGISCGASVMESVAMPWRNKRGTSKPQQSFSNIMQGLEVITKIL